MKPAIIVVDEQYDFMPGGTLAVPYGDSVIPYTNILIQEVLRSNGIVVFSRDWHPTDTLHFVTRGGPWPPHCVQNTHGAEFHHDLGIPDEAIIVTKGDDPEDDGGYSAFSGRDDKGRYLYEILEDVNKLIVVGLATDYCVKATVLDACRLGYDVRVAYEAIRAVEINTGDEDKAITDMMTAGAAVVKAANVWLDKQWLR